MKVGIDRLSFFIPNLYLDMTELAERREMILLNTISVLAKIKWPSTECQKIS